MSVQPKAPGGPDPSWWQQLLGFLALVAMWTAMGAMLAVGLRSCNSLIAEAVTEGRPGQ
jgi:hypothetical protein